MNFKKYHVSKNLFDKNSAPSVGWYCGSDDIIRSSTAIKATYIPCSPNTTYTIAKVQSARFKVAWTANEPALGVTYYGLTNVSGTSVTVTTGSTASYLYIEYYTSASDTYTEAEIRNTIMLNSGSTPQPYEPYSSEVWHDIPHYIMGTSTDTLTTLPADLYADGNNATVGLVGNMYQASGVSPDNPIQPQECGERTGNLFRLYKSGYRYDNSGNEIEYSSTNIYAFSAKETKTYTINWSYPAGIATNTVRIFGFYQGNPVALITVNINVNSVPYTFTTDVTIDEYRLSVSNQVYDMIANEGETAKPYEPYGVKIPISSANTTTPVYLGEVETTRKVKKLVLDGTESSWIVAGTGDSECFRLDITGYLYNTINICYCTHYESQQNITRVADVVDKHCAFYANPNNIYYSFNIKDTTYTTVETFKEYLQQQYAAGTPVCIWYVLATPTTGIVNEPLRKIGNYADTVSGITIPTTTGKDTFDVLTTLKPSEVSLAYTGWHDASAKEWDGSEWD